MLRGIIMTRGRVGVNSIPELELKLVELKNGIGIEIPGIGVENRNWFFCNCYCTYYLLVNQPFPNFSFKTGGHNLSCDWLLMQQVCLLSSWDIAPCGVVTKDHGEGTLYPLSRQRPEGLKMVTINISSPQWHKQNYCQCWINKWFQGLGWNYPNILSFSLILLIDIFRSFMILHRDKCHSFLFSCLRLRQWPVTYLITLSDWIMICQPGRHAVVMVCEPDWKHKWAAYKSFDETSSFNNL